jgi:nickel-dependent lactate racemase
MPPADPPLPSPGPRALREDLRSGGRVRFAEGGPGAVIDRERAERLLDGLLAGLGKLDRVLLLPPDFTRFHSGAGELTSLIYARLSKRATVEVLPALGTHAPMTAEDVQTMFPGIPLDRFFVHEWRSGLTLLGEVPASFVGEASGGRVNYPIRCEIDSRIADGHWDRIFSIGQLVPHEVIGIAGHDKNVFVGAGGKDVIDRTHFLGAVCGMESIMGRAETPVRDVMRYMAKELASHLPITHVLTVRSRDESGKMRTRGLFAGEGHAVFAAGAPLAQTANLEFLDAPLPKVVVYLDPAEFHSTWLGNKAVYRTRMALADGGELLILAPGVARFGEDPEIDRLIRRYGYCGTPKTLEAVASDPELAGSLSAAAHLIHGSSEGRFRIVYAPGKLTREEVTGVGYEYADLDAAFRRYDPTRLRPGKNVLPDGEEIFFVQNPALGLWGLRSQFAGA